MNYIMTFGECLDSLLKSKKISVSGLAEATGTKSRNSIRRILKDECSINVMEAFNSKLIESDPLALSEAEREQLAQALEVSKVGMDTYQARKILLQLFDNSGQIRKSENPLALNPATKETIPLRELFATYKVYAKLNLVIYDAVSSEFSDELVDMIRNSASTHISVSQLLYLRNSSIHNAETFASIFKLFNYEHYNLYSTPSEPVLDKTAVPSGFIIIDKETAEGGHATDLIRMDHGGSISFIQDMPGNSLYHFYLHHFDSLKMNSQIIRRTYSKKNPVETVLNISKFSMQLGENTNEYRIQHGLSYLMIPYDILLNMAAETNYFGLGKNNPIFQNLKQVWYERFYNCYNIDTSKVHILTKRGLLDFVKNGVLSDHFCYFRPFTAEEIKGTLEFILKQLTEKDFLKILLLKNDYALGNIQFLYYENKAFWLFDASSGYNENYFEGFIDSAPILEILDDFIKNELISNHTWPESETIEFLEHLIANCDCQPS